MVPSRQAARTTLALIAGLVVLLAGCPKKLTEKVETPVEKRVEVPVQVDRKVPVASLVMVAQVKSAGKQKAVLACGTYATVVAVGDRVGVEGAAVLNITGGGVNVQLPTGGETMLPQATEMPADCGAETTGAATGGDTAGATGGQPAASHTAAEVEAAEALAVWRSYVITHIKKGYGVPVDVLRAVSMATSSHTGPKVADALAQIGWTPVDGIEQALMTRIEIKNGAVTAQGTAPNKATFDALLSRLQRANPLIDKADIIQSEGVGGVLKFQLSMKAWLITGSQVADGTHQPASKPMPVDVKMSLDKTSADLPQSSALGGFDAALKQLADKSGVVATVTRGRTTEDGYLGTVSFEVTTRGPTQDLILFLDRVRQERVSDFPVVVDPLVVSAGQAKMTLLVPYVSGKADTRSPTPTVPMPMPSMTADRWKSARSIRRRELRDPFKN